MFDDRLTRQPCRSVAGDESTPVNDRFCLVQLVKPIGGLAAQGHASQRARRA
jgi:hypothetical protein